MNAPRRDFSAVPAPNARAAGVHPLFVVAAPRPAADSAAPLASPAHPGHGPWLAISAVIPGPSTVHGVRAPRRLVAGALALFLGAAAFLAPADRAAAAESATPAGPESVIYPKNSPDRPKAPAPTADDFPVAGAIAVGLLLVAGGWMVFQRGNFRLKPTGPDGRRLAIEETRPLGGKQFLAVATYGDRKLLLAVCPGKIDLLCRLDDGARGEKPAADARAG